MNKFVIADKVFQSRLFMGTGHFRSNELVVEAIKTAKIEMVTAALKRINLEDKKSDDLLRNIPRPGVHVLPSTSGALNAKEAILLARMAREAFDTNWIKLEIHNDPKHKLPDSFDVYEATVELVKDGFVVLPFVQPDPLLCIRLADAGAAAVMPFGAPIGTSKGLETKELLKIIIEECRVPVVLNGGIGTPADAAAVMEMGAGGVLVNTAISSAKNPDQMALAFKEAIEAGRKAYLAGIVKGRHQVVEE